MNDSTNTVTTWADVWDAATAATEVTAADVADWVEENPTTAAATALAVGVGIGYLLFN